ncbi:hypothetical protein Aple_019410 [Acrocarpospora pleiomorpha]|uniref:Uncharacterized protein n=1 Tax=Acrocarpospora pleiomorpha TaxID=90975 RepID=A0A5M3XBJ6_9ACTN|nr:hypothetical protein [Acrocarpospora pleiomorpha]GES19045.1 hypothetical protein Aple_019410 [Acrocarpospora pleiomorpha]
MSLLEESYRRVLRLLPASYRAKREEEMVAAYLESAGDVGDEDGPRPSWPEIASVAALSMRVRLGGVGAAPRFFAWGQTIRLVALLGLFFQTVISCVYFGGFLRTYDEYGFPGSMIQTLASGLWIAAFVTLAWDRVRAAKVLALLALAQQLFLIAATVDGEYLLVRLPYTLLTLVPVLALTAGFHRDAPQVRRTWWLTPTPLGAGILLSVALGVAAVELNLRLPASWAWLDEAGLASLLIVIAGLARVGAHWHSPALRTPSWPLALAILAVPVLCARFPALNFGATDSITQTMTAVALGQSIAVALTCLILVVLGARALLAIPRDQVAES